MAKRRSEKGKLWLKQETGVYTGVVLLLTVLSVLVTLCSLAFAYLVRYLINSATSGKEARLWIFSALLLGVLLLKILSRFLHFFLSERFRSKIYVELRTRSFAKILRADYARLQGYHSGDLLNRLTSDAQDISASTVGLLPTVCGMAVQCLGAVVALLTIDPLFTGIYVICGIALVTVSTLFRKQVKKRHKEVLQADGEARSFMQEGLTSAMTVKAYGAEGKAAQKAEGLSDVYYRKRMKRNVLRTQMDFIFSILSNFGLIFAVVWCSVSVLRGNDDYGSILSVILLLMQLQQPLTSFSSVLPAYYARLASAERLAELDELPVEKTGKENTELAALYADMQALQFENVRFAYDREKLFDGANACAKKGEIVCLTGSSGAGKSTLFKLLLNVFQAKEGGAYLLGKERTGITERERGLFAYVPQGNFLFSGTIYENLTFFIPKEVEITEGKIGQALSTACAEFVFGLPQGLQTKLAEGGEGLSEGQRQRLNVARALLSERPILLLDEATSALDSETEKKLLENIRGLQDKTCFIVTHRPAALEIADRVWVVENGRITERVCKN